MRSFNFSLSCPPRVVLRALRAGTCRRSISRQGRSCAGLTKAAAVQQQVWRPSLDDVQRISMGDAARHRGTGSRAVPHRLNSEERKQYDLAKQKGFLTLAGSGYRRERKGAPLANIWRQWCDAKALPCVLVAKGSAAGDTVLVDLSTLRLPDAEQHRQACRAVAQQHGSSIDAESRQFSPFTVILPPKLVAAMLEGSLMGESSSKSSSSGSSSTSRSAEIANGSSASGSDEVGSLPGSSAAPAAALEAAPSAEEQGVPAAASAATGAAAAADATAAHAEASPEAPSTAAAEAATETAAAVPLSEMDVLLQELRSTAVIWQQQPLLECFLADRATAKTLAKELAEQLRALA